MFPRKVQRKTSLREVKQPKDKKHCADLPDLKDGFIQQNMLYVLHDYYMRHVWVLKVLVLVKAQTRCIWLSLHVLRKYIGNKKGKHMACIQRGHHVTQYIMDHRIVYGSILYTCFVIPRRRPAYVTKTLSHKWTQIRETCRLKPKISYNITVQKETRNTAISVRQRLPFWVVKPINKHVYQYVSQDIVTDTDTTRMVWMNLVLDKVTCPFL